MIFQTLKELCKFDLFVFYFFRILLHFTTIVKEKVNSFKHLKKLLGERNVISFYHICHNPLLIIARKLKMNKFQSLKISSLLLLLLKRHLDFGLFIVVFFGHSFFNLGIIPKPKKFSTSELGKKLKWSPKLTLLYWNMVLSNVISPYLKLVIA